MDDVYRAEQRREEKDLELEGKGRKAKAGPVAVGRTTTTVPLPPKSELNNTTGDKPAGRPRRAAAGAAGPTANSGAAPFPSLHGLRNWRCAFLHIYSARPQLTLPLFPAHFMGVGPNEGG